MIIFLDASLVGGLNGGTDRAAILGALTVCAQQAREGVHLLLADRATFTDLEAFYPEMDPRTVATLRRSSEKLTLRKQLRDFVTRAVRVVSDSVATTPVRVAVGKREEIVIPASVVDGNSSLVGKPLLMVENVNDGHAYVRLAESITNAGVISDFDWLKAIPLRCEIAPGGGNTLANLFTYHKDLASRIGIGVADGDFRYAGAPVGDTARALQNAAASPPVTPLLETLVLGVRTIENCLPRAEVGRLAAELDSIQLRRFNRIEDIFSQSPFWGVVPIKGGVRCFELGQTAAESVFWTALFGARRCAPTNACAKKSDCGQFVLPPVSDKILARAVASKRPFAVTSTCLSGIVDVWRQLLLCFYSMFCGTDRAAMI